MRHDVHKPEGYWGFGSLAAEASDLYRVDDSKIMAQPSAAHRMKCSVLGFGIPRKYMSCCAGMAAGCVWPPGSLEFASPGYAGSADV